jgi:Fe-S-cluster containining protein
MSESADRVEIDSKPKLPLFELPGTHPCNSCGECCRYVAVEIDRPTTPRDYDQIHWYVTHRGVAVYVDWEGDWYLEFETVCDHLTPAATCGVYRDRPELCAEFSWETCEKSTGEPGHRVRFTQPSEFFEWLETKRPRSFEKYVDYRRRLIEARDAGDSGEAAPSGKRKPKAA